MDENRPTRCEAVKRFLMLKAPPDLAERYNFNMEMQCNVAPGNGVREEGDYEGRMWHGWIGQAGDKWKSFRVPYNAGTEPNYEEKTMHFDLAKHVEAIGMTGWNWVDRCSEWVGFDFDAILGHAVSHTKKLSEEQLREIAEIVQDIPWVTLRKSTSGKGLHIYVYLDRFPTANHREHAAVARAILSHMSAFVNFDFQAKADACGGNMWVWHRKMAGTDGLTILKQGGILNEIPPNWRDHIGVVSSKRNRNLPQFIAEGTPDHDDMEKVFEEITGQRMNQPLDAAHKRLIEWLRETGAMWWWDSDYHMLVTHTVHLKEAHETLGLKGMFETIAIGTERGADHNCYAFPMRNGAWVVRRYTPGTSEAPTWDQDKCGYTRCYLNRDPDLAIASRSCGGVEHVSGGYVFANAAEKAKETAALLGANLDIGPEYVTRTVRLRQREDKLLIEMERKEDDYAPKMTQAAWVLDGKKWKKVLTIRVDNSVESMSLGNYDEQVRHIVNQESQDAGWVVKSENRWQEEPLKHTQMVLAAAGMTPKERDVAMGSLVIRPWVLVNRPFQPEYPGDRCWNRNSPQFRYPRADEHDPTKYPTWLKVFQHLGKGLDESIQENPWARASAIVSGADYLKCWVASLFQNPMDPLPYLFFYSPEQNTGKTTFHEAIELLMTKGVQRADRALDSPQGFNGELASAVLCVIEETNLKANKTAYNRIKDWVTSQNFPVHAKRGTPYTIPNSTHWVQCANDPTFCPIFPNDTRITMIHVEALDPGKMIPRKQLFDQLAHEASHFIAALFNVEIPPSGDRLAVPVITTAEKVLVQATNETLVETFLRENTHHVPGMMIPVGELWERFLATLNDRESGEWTKIRMSREIPSRYPKGRNPKDSQWNFGNISWEPWKAGDPKLPTLISKHEKLIAMSKATG